MRCPKLALVVGLVLAFGAQAGVAEAGRKKKIDWSEYIESPSERARPITTQSNKRVVAERSKRKSKVKKAKAKRGGKAKARRTKAKRSRR